MKKCVLTMVAGMLLFSACGSGSSNNQEQASHQHEEATVAQSEHAMLGVNGACGMCKERIEKAALSVEGVSSANWDSEKQEVHLNFDPAKTSVDAISKAIAKAGHDTGKDKADDAVYNALPECCKYRK